MPFHFVPSILPHPTWPKVVSHREVQDFLLQEDFPPEHLARCATAFMTLNGYAPAIVGPAGGRCYVWVAKGLGPEAEQEALANFIPPKPKPQT